LIRYGVLIPSEVDALLAAVSGGSDSGDTSEPVEQNDVTPSSEVDALLAEANPTVPTVDGEADSASSGSVSSGRMREEVTLNPGDVAEVSAGTGGTSGDSTPGELSQDDHDAILNRAADRARRAKTEAEIQNISEAYVRNMIFGAEDERIAVLTYEENRFNEMTDVFSEEERVALREQFNANIREASHSIAIADGNSAAETPSAPALSGTGSDVDTILAGVELRINNTNEASVRRMMQDAADGGISFKEYQERAFGLLEDSLLAPLPEADVAALKERYYGKIAQAAYSIAAADGGSGAETPSAPTGDGAGDDAVLISDTVNALRSEIDGISTPYLISIAHAARSRGVSLDVGIEESFNVMVNSLGESERAGFRAAFKSTYDGKIAAVMDGTLNQLADAYGDAPRDEDADKAAVRTVIDGINREYVTRLVIEAESEGITFEEMRNRDYARVVSGLRDTYRTEHRVAYDAKVSDAEVELAKRVAVAEPARPSGEDTHRMTQEERDRVQAASEGRGTEGLPGLDLLQRGIADRINEIDEAYVGDMIQQAEAQGINFIDYQNQEFDRIADPLPQARRDALRPIYDAKISDAAEKVAYADIGVDSPIPEPTAPAGTGAGTPPAPSEPAGDEPAGTGAPIPPPGDGDGGLPPDYVTLAAKADQLESRLTQLTEALAQSNAAKDEESRLRQEAYALRDAAVAEKGEESRLRQDAYTERDAARAAEAATRTAAADQVAEANRLRAEAYTLRDTSQTELATRTADLAARDATLTATQAERDDLGTRLTTAETERDDVRTERDTYRTQAADRETQRVDAEGRVTDAQTQLDGARDRIANIYETRSAQAQTLLDHGEYIDAAIAYRALHDDAANPETRLDPALMQTRLDESITNAIVDLNTRYHDSAASVVSATRMHDEFTRLRTVSQHPSIICNVGIAAYDMGERGDAIRAINEAIGLNAGLYDSLAVTRPEILNALRGSINRPPTATHP
ncbi:hypothetical protein ACFLZ6_01895, partial [Nanoarchaeota archaeon]